MSLDAPSMERAAAPYREPAKRSAAAASASVVLDLDAAPPGRSPANLDAEVFRDALASSDEWDRTWVAVWLAYRQASLRKPLDARVTLETALESVETPAYRALIFAKLAQHAASIGAPGLAKKWLKARPDAPFPEVESEVRAARALIAHAKDRVEDVIEMTGDTVAGKGFHQGSSMLIAIALNIAANGRVGRTRVAEAVAGDCARKGMLAGVIVTMHVFRISQEVIDNLVRRLRMRSAAIAGAVAAAFFVYAWVGLGYPLARTAVGGAVGVAWSAGFAWWSLSWSLAGTTRAGRARRKLLEWGGAAACVAIPMFWLTRASPPPPPPRSADAPASDEQVPAGARVDQPPPSGVIVIPPEELGR